MTPVIDRAHARIDQLPLDTERGTMGMQLALATEAFLFVSLFFAYFYTGHFHDRWPDNPPKYGLALALLAILVTSSVTLELARHSLKKGARVRARVLLVATIFLGAAFVVVQSLEYMMKLREVRPTDSAYGSLFYTTTSFHALHVAFGLLALIYVAALPSLEPRPESPHRPLHNVSLYWHFVDLVWLFIVGLLYLLPHWTR